jgi:hypothetical protein
VDCKLAIFIQSINKVATIYLYWKFSSWLLLHIIHFKAASETSPTIHQTGLGKWETRVYLDVDFRSIKTCSTFKPREALAKGVINAYTLGISLSRRDDYEISNDTCVYRG